MALVTGQLHGVIRYAAASFLLVTGYGFYMNMRPKKYELVKVTSPALVETPRENAMRRHLELMTKAAAVYGSSDTSTTDLPAAAALPEDERFEPDPQIRECMKQYQVDHPAGYRLFDAVEHCDCVLPPGVSIEKLKGIFVRSQDHVSDSLTEVELRMMGVRTTEPLLPYAEAKRLRKVGLPKGVDPSKPRNLLLEGAYQVTPREGAWEDLGMENYWDPVKWKVGQYKYGSLWDRDTWGG